MAAWLQHNLACLRLAWRAWRNASRLTRRQRQAARLAANGLTNRQIAAQLGLSVHTVKEHLDAAYRTLGVHGRRQLSRPAVRRWLR